MTGASTDSISASPDTTWPACGSPYMWQEDIRLREDSQGNIEGVEYLVHMAGYGSDCDSGYRSRQASLVLKLHTSNAGQHFYDQRLSSREESALHGKDCGDVARDLDLKDASSPMRSGSCTPKLPSPRSRFSWPRTPNRDALASESAIPHLSLEEHRAPKHEPMFGEGPQRNDNPRRPPAEVVPHGPTEMVVPKASLMSSEHVIVDCEVLRPNFEEGVSPGSEAH